MLHHQEVQKRIYKYQITILEWNYKKDELQTNWENSNNINLVKNLEIFIKYSNECSHFFDKSIFDSCQFKIYDILSVFHRKEVVHQLYKSLQFKSINT